MESVNDTTASNPGNSGVADGRMAPCQAPRYSGLNWCEEDIVRENPNIRRLPRVEEQGFSFTDGDVYLFHIKTNNCCDSGHNCSQTECHCSSTAVHELMMSFCTALNTLVESRSRMCQRTLALLVRHYDDVASLMQWVETDGSRNREFVGQRNAGGRTTVPIARRSVAPAPVPSWNISRSANVASPISDVSSVVSLSSSTSSGTLSDVSDVTTAASVRGESATRVAGQQGCSGSGSGSTSSTQKSRSVLFTKQALIDGKRQELAMSNSASLSAAVPHPPENMRGLQNSEPRLSTINDGFQRSVQPRENVTEGGNADAVENAADSHSRLASLKERNASTLSLEGSDGAIKTPNDTTRIIEKPFESQFKSALAKVDNREADNDDEDDATTIGVPSPVSFGRTSRLSTDSRQSIESGQSGKASEDSSSNTEQRSSKKRVGSYRPAPASVKRARAAAASTRVSSSPAKEYASVESNIGSNASEKLADDNEPMVDDELVSSTTEPTPTMATMDVNRDSTTMTETMPLGNSADELNQSSPFFEQQLRNTSGEEKRNDDRSTTSTGSGSSVEVIHVVPPPAESPFVQPKRPNVTKLDNHTTSTERTTRSQTKASVTFPIPQLPAVPISESGLSEVPLMERLKNKKKRINVTKPEPPPPPRISGIGKSDKSRASPNVNEERIRRGEQSIRNGISGQEEREPVIPDDEDDDIQIIEEVPTGPRMMTDSNASEPSRASRSRSADMTDSYAVASNELEEESISKEQNIHISLKRKTDVAKPTLNKSTSLLNPVTADEDEDQNSWLPRGIPSPRKVQEISSGNLSPETLQSHQDESRRRLTKSTSVPETSSSSAPNNPNSNVAVSRARNVDFDPRTEAVRIGPKVPAKVTKDTIAESLQNKPKALPKPPEVAAVVKDVTKPTLGLPSRKHLETLAAAGGNRQSSAPKTKPDAILGPDGEIRIMSTPRPSNSSNNSGISNVATFTTISTQGRRPFSNPPPITTRASNPSPDSTVGDKGPDASETNDSVNSKSNETEERGGHQSGGVLSDAPRQHLVSASYGSSEFTTESASVPVSRSRDLIQGNEESRGNRDWSTERTGRERSPYRGPEMHGREDSGRGRRGGRTRTPSPASPTFDKDRSSFRNRSRSPPGEYNRLSTSKVTGRRSTSPFDRDRRVESRSPSPSSVHRQPPLRRRGSRSPDKFTTRSSSRGRGQHQGGLRRGRSSERQYFSRSRSRSPPQNYRNPSPNASPELPLPSRSHSSLRSPPDSCNDVPISPEISLGANIPTDPRLQPRPGRPNPYNSNESTDRSRHTSASGSSSSFEDNVRRDNMRNSRSRSRSRGPSPSERSGNRDTYNNHRGGQRGGGRGGYNPNYNGYNQVHHQNDYFQGGRGVPRYPFPGGGRGGRGGRGYQPNRFPHRGRGRFPP